MLKKRTEMTTENPSEYAKNNSKNNSEKCNKEIDDEENMIDHYDGYSITKKEIEDVDEDDDGGDNDDNDDDDNAKQQQQRTATIKTRATVDEQIENGEEKMDYTSDNEAKEENELKNESEEELDLSQKDSEQDQVALISNQITLNALHSIQMRMAQLATAPMDANSEDALKNLAILQSTIFSLQNQRELQLQFIQNLQSFMAMSQMNQMKDDESENETLEENEKENLNEMEKLDNEISEKINHKREDPEERKPNECFIRTRDFSSETKFSQPTPEKMQSSPKSSLRPISPAQTTLSSREKASPMKDPISAYYNSPLASTIITNHDSPPPPGMPNSLEMLQKRTQEVLNSASHGLLAGNLADELAFRRDKSSTYDSKDGGISTKHRCRYCGKVFGSDSGLQIHIRSHTGERPFKCNVCGSRFTTKGNLKVHFQRHTQKFPHIQMNPNPIPEHLDKFYPPLITQSPSSGAASPPPPLEQQPKPPLYFPFPVPFPGDVRIPEQALYRPPLDFLKALGSFAPHPMFKPPPNILVKPPSDQDQPTDLSTKKKSDTSSPDITAEKIKKEFEDDARTSPEDSLKNFNLKRDIEVRQRKRSIDDECETGSIKSNGEHLDNQKSAAYLNKKICENSDHVENLSIKSSSQSPQPKPMPLPVASPIGLPKFMPNQMGPEQMNPEMKNPMMYSPLLSRPGLIDNSWENLIEVTNSSETTKLQQLVDNIEDKLIDPNQCIICHRVLSCKSALQMHYRIHTGEKPFRCRICGRAFTTKGNLKTHISVHQIKPPIRTLPQCPICYKKFSNTLYLQQHIRLHTGEPTDLTVEQIQAAEIKDFPSMPMGFPNMRMMMPSSDPRDHHHRAMMDAAHKNDDRYGMDSDDDFMDEENYVDDLNSETGQSSISNLNRSSSPDKMMSIDKSESLPSPSVALRSSPSLSEASQGAIDLTPKQMTKSPSPSLQRQHLQPSPQHHPQPLPHPQPPQLLTQLPPQPQQPQQPQSQQQQPPRGGPPPPPGPPSMFSNFPFMSRGPVDPMNPFLNNALMSLAHSITPPGGINSIGLSGGRGGTTCNICLKTFPCHSALAIHYRSHTKERPFICTICDRGFSTKGNMKQHLLTHKIRDMPQYMFRSQNQSPDSNYSSSKKFERSHSADPQMKTSSYRDNNKQSSNSFQSRILNDKNESMSSEPEFTNHELKRPASSPIDDLSVSKRSSRMMTLSVTS